MELDVEVPGNLLKRNVAEKMLCSVENRGDKNREVDGDRTVTEDDGGNASGKEISIHGGEKTETGYNKDKPPEDDCCPICFGEFKVPCKANCGHWFCGNCILQLWKYRSRPRRCKCPFCSSAISKFTPEASAASNTVKEVVVVLQEIEQYNCFYVKGLKGFILILAFYARKYGPFMHVYMWRLLRAFFMVVITTPSFIVRTFVDLIRHPEQIRFNFQRVRLIACTLSLLLHLYHCFLPPGRGRLQLTKMRLYIDCASLILVLLPYAVVMCKTWLHISWLRFRIWQLRRQVDALRAQNAILRAQEAALRVEIDVLKQAGILLEEIAILLAQNHAALQAEVVLARHVLDRTLQKPNASLQGESEVRLQAEADSTSRTQHDAALRRPVIKASLVPENKDDSAALQAQDINTSRVTVIVGKVERDASSLAQDFYESQETGSDVSREVYPCLQEKDTNVSREIQNVTEIASATGIQRQDMNPSRETNDHDVAVLQAQKQANLLPKIDMLD